MNRGTTSVGQAQSRYVDNQYKQQRDKARVNWDGAHYLALDVQYSQRIEQRVRRAQEEERREEGEE